ncbi:glycosyltransferase family 87 protein [Tardiphaga sp. 862_B3_N4_1]|uniref:glycosyltransferase family 87 protein n=1 Tax=Tardiphaga sp. 862_B3_N4_1 TaxID=3240764 RepID=UPI003F29A511
MLRGFVAKNWGWIVLALVAAAYYPRYVRSGGMLLYRHAAECLWTQQIMQACDVGFTYPPAFAFLILPFASVPLWLAVLIWYVITLACTAQCLILCKEIAQEQIPGDWTGTRLVTFETLSFLISLKFILAVYEDQAFDMLGLVFVLFGIRGLMRNQNYSAGVALAIAAAVKVTPLIFLPYLIFRRRFAAAGIFLAALVAISFLPDLFFTPKGSSSGYFMTWLKEIAAPGLFDKANASRYAFWDTANPLNLSLRGMVALAVDQTSAQEHFAAIYRATQIAFVLAVGPLFLLTRRWQMTAIEGSLLIIAMLMLSPMSGRGHFVQLMLPFCILVAACLVDQRTKAFGIGTLVVSFIFCTGIPRDIAPKAFNLFMTMHSDITWGTLVLLPYIAIIVFRPFQWQIRPVATEARQRPTQTSAVLR